MDQEQVIGKAIVFIENNLYEPIAACDVADAVAYSYYHFHRYFQAVMGETIGSYIRSRRLTQAAWDLVHTRKKILDIGISLYFETAEGFTRAFKNRFSMTPTEYRKNGIDVLLGNRQPADTGRKAVVPHSGPDPAIVILSPVIIMGFRFETTAAGDSCAPMWETFSRCLSANADKELLIHNQYCVFEGGETCASDVFSADSKASAFIGIEVSENTPLLPGMEIKKLTGGKYARFVHRGATDTLIETYRYIWGVWFPKSGCELSSHDDLECYTERFLGAYDENSEIDLYFPVR